MLSKAAKPYLAIQSDTEPTPSACPFSPLSAAHRRRPSLPAALLVPFGSAADGPPALLLLIYCQVFTCRELTASPVTCEVPHFACPGTLEGGVKAFLLCPPPGTTKKEGAQQRTSGKQSIRATYAEGA